MRGGKRRAVGSALVLPLALALLPHTSLGFHALPQAWSPPGLRLGACSAGRAALGSGAVVCSLGGAGGRGGKGVFARRKDTRADMAPHVRSWGRGEGAGKAGRGKGGLKAGEAPTGEAEQVTTIAPEEKGATDEKPAISTLHKRSDAHWSRKAFHAGMGLAVATCRTGLDQSGFLRLFTPLLLLSFFIEVLRINVGGFVERTFLKIGGRLMRDDESNKFTTTCYFQLGVVLAVMLFPAPASLLAIVTLAIGDPVASIFGRASASLPPSKLKNFLRRKTIGSKSVAGSLAFAVAAFIANVAVLRVVASVALPAGADSFAIPRIFAMSLAAAVAGSIAELCANDAFTLPWKRLPLTLDDNLTIPLAAGAAASFFL